MKHIRMFGFVFAATLLLAGAGCASEPEETTADLSITELGITVTVPATYKYSRIDEGIYHLTTPGGSKTVTLQKFGPPDVPAEAVKNAEGLAAALDSILEDFELTNEETFDTGFTIDYTVGTDEAFSTIVRTADGTFLCEPEAGAFLFNFEDLKNICASIR